MLILFELFPSFGELMQLEVGEPTKTSVLAFKKQVHEELAHRCRRVPIKIYIRMDMPLESKIPFVRDWMRATSEWRDCSSNYRPAASYVAVPESADSMLLSELEFQERPTICIHFKEGSNGEGGAVKASALSAITLGNCAALELLLVNGFDVAGAFWPDGTALQLAVKGGHTEVIKLLCSTFSPSPKCARRIAALTALDSGGNTPLHLAIAGQSRRSSGASSAEPRPLHASEIPFLMCKSNMETPNHQDLSPLLMSIVANQKRSTDVLIDNGCNVSARAKYGRTPLHLACQFQRMDIVKRLLDAGGELNVRDADGRLPIFDAFLYKIPPDDIEDVLQFFKANGATITGADNEGNTLLHHAVSAVRVAHPIVDYLICPSNVTATNNRGESVLHAVLRGSVSDTILEKIIEGGADVDAAECQGWAPLHMAARFGLVSFVKILLSSGSDVSAVDKLGLIALQHTKNDATSEVLKLLLDAGIEVTDQALSDTADSGHWQKLRVLLDNVVDDRKYKARCR